MQTMTAAVLAVLVATPVAAQRTTPSEPVLAGTVRTAAGAPVPDAEVRVLATGRGGVTDTEGRFEVRGVAAGRYSVEVTRIGYRAVAVAVELPEGGGRTTLDVVLAPSPLALAGLQVTATPGARDGSAIAQSTLQLAGSALERNLGSSVAQTLATQPGMDVRYNGPAAALPVVRGLTGDRVLVLQDGQRVSDLSGSADDHALTIDPLGAQRVEVVRGPASLLYGTNALGGVVHVISADAPARIPPRLQVSAALQSETALPGASAAARAVVPVGPEWAVSVRGSARSTADVRIPRDATFGARLPNTHQRSGGGAVGIGRSSRRADGGLTVQAHVMEHGVPLPADAGEEIVLRGRRLAASGRVEFRRSRGPGSLRVQAAVTDYVHDELANGTLAMAFGLRTGTADVVLRHGELGPLTEGAWGVSGLVRRYAATGEDQLTAPADAGSWGVFTFQELALGRGAALQAGARVDNYAIASRDDPRFGAGIRRTFSAVSGSVGVAAPLAGAVSGAVHVARSFRAPTVEELFSDALHIGTASYEIGDPRLAPEVATGVDAVLRVRSRTLDAELSAWLNSIDDFVHFEARGDTVLDGVTWPVLRHVQDGARLAGAEATLSWEATTAWIVTVQGDVVRGRLSGNRAIPFLPAGRASVAVRRDVGRSDVGAAVRHALAQRRVAEGETAVPGNTLLDAHAAIRFGTGGRTHSLTLRLENALDASYRTASSRIKDFAPNPGRNLSLLYRVHF